MMIRKLPLYPTFRMIQEQRLTRLSMDGFFLLFLILNSISK